MLWMCSRFVLFGNMIFVSSLLKSGNCARVSFGRCNSDAGFEWQLSRLMEFILSSTSSKASRSLQSNAFRPPCVIMAHTATTTISAYMTASFRAVMVKAPTCFLRDCSQRNSQTPARNTRTVDRCDFNMAVLRRCWPIV